MAKKTFLVPYVAAEHYYLWREWHIRRDGREPSEQAIAAHAAGHLGRQDTVTATTPLAAAAIVRSKYPGYSVITESILAL